MKPQIVLLYVIIGALLILWIGEKCAPDPKPGIPIAVIDSVALRARISAAVDSAQAVSDSIGESLRHMAQQQANRAAASERATARARAGADSLRGALEDAKSAQDSVPILVATVVKLDAAVASQDTTITSLRGIIKTDSLDVARITNDLRIMAVDRDGWKLQTDRAMDVARDLEKRWQKTQRSPTKTEAFLFGVVGGAGLIVALANLSGG